MSDLEGTPEVAAVETPPTPPSTGTGVKSTKAKSRAKPKGGSEKPSGVVAMLWRIAVNAENIDWNQVYMDGGYKSAKSAQESFRVAKKRHLEAMEAVAVNGVDNDAGGDDNDAPVQAKKRKSTKTADGETGAKKARKTKAEKEAEKEAIEEE